MWLTYIEKCNKMWSFNGCLEEENTCVIGCAMKVLYLQFEGTFEHKDSFPWCCMFNLLQFHKTDLLQNKISVNNVWIYMSHDMTKPTKWLCAQRRHRSACASVQSDRSLCCVLRTQTFFKRTAKTLIRLFSRDVLLKSNQWWSERTYFCHLWQIWI